MTTLHTHIALRRLWWAGPLSVVSAVAAVLAVRVAAFAALDLSPTFPPLTWNALVVFTTVLVTAGVGVFAGVALAAANPIRLYRRIALGFLAVSMIPDLLLPGRGPGATWTASVVLMVMHVAAWWPAASILTRCTIGPHANPPPAR